MRSRSWSPASPLSIGLVSLLAACATTQPSPAPAETPPSSNPVPAPIEAKDVQGHWTGDWGDLYLRTDPDGTVRGVYSHDEGSVVGRVENNVFRGWWCEAPSRQPDGDAGDVEFVFGHGTAALTLDGRWRYGATTTDWRDDWDLTFTDAPADPSLVAAFDDLARFCPHP